MSYVDKQRIADSAGVDGISVLNETLQEILVELKKLTLMMSEGMNIYVDNDELTEGEN